MSAGPVRCLLLTGLLTLTGQSVSQADPPTASALLSADTTLSDPKGRPLGSASFRQAGAGMQIEVRDSGLTPGMHGLYLHEYGRCTPGVDAPTNTVVPFGGAGGHFDSGRSGNHDSPTAANTSGHGGDLPMLMVGADGAGSLSFTTLKSSLNGTNGVLGRSLIVHAMPDNYESDPAGLSGRRERCGVIARTGTNIAGANVTGGPLGLQNYLLPGP